MNRVFQTQTALDLNVSHGEDTLNNFFKGGLHFKKGARDGIHSHSTTPPFRRAVKSSISIQSRLKKQLRQFGLNPRDWEIRRQKEGSGKNKGIFLIQHRNERGFCFRGKAITYPACTYWQDMRLISL